MSEFEDDPAEPPRGHDAPEVADPEVLPEVPAAEEATLAEMYQQRARLAEDRLAEVLAAYRESRKETEAYRDRLTRQYQRKFDQRHEALLLQFIDVLDNFDRALEASQTAGDSLVEGLILVRTQLLQMLQDEGLERIPVVGLPFDPHVSEAVTTVPVDDPDQHHVVMQEMLRGYRIKGKIARASRVAIGEYAGAAVEASPARHAQEPLIGEAAAGVSVATVAAVVAEAVQAVEAAESAKAAESDVVEAVQEVEAVEEVVAVEAEAVEEVETLEVEPVVGEVEPEILEVDADPQVQEADSGLSLDEIIARAEARDVEDHPAAQPAAETILYDDLTELAEVDEEVVRAEEGEALGADDDDE